MEWKIITPNKEGDWINHRDIAFDTFIPITPEEKFDTKSQSFFVSNSLGLSSNRDFWVYNSSKQKIVENMTSMSNFFNEQVTSYQNSLKNNPKLDFKEIQVYNPKIISWSSGLVSMASSGNKAIFKKNNLVISQYRPFYKQYLYFDKIFNERPGQNSKYFPNPQLGNLVICVSGIGVTKEFSSLVTNKLPNLDLLGKSQCYPLYYYEEIGDKKKREIKSSQTLLETDEPEPLNKYIKRDGISDFIFEKAKKQYGESGLTKEDIFYYVYGVLHSPDYQKAFSNNLKKMLPKIPLVDNIADFNSFSMAGRKLSDLHLNYETVPPYSDVKVTGTEGEYFTISKMKFPKKDQKDTIIYNSKITISEIPDKAFQYIVNGKSAIEWIMERYQITTDKDSGIINDPNDWAIEEDNPRYILDLLLSIINLSVQTVDIVDGLPELKFE
ncbi:MAG: type ISP restriction/modification enzyme [Candidatus Methanoperedens sp.]|nr:type ISP restriction/modification enzyme [Candidatus Methanoperedens sp.]